MLGRQYIHSSKSLSGCKVQAQDFVYRAKIQHHIAASDLVKLTRIQLVLIWVLYCPLGGSV